MVAKSSMLNFKTICLPIHLRLYKDLAVSMLIALKNDKFKAAYIFNVLYDNLQVSDKVWSKLFDISISPNKKKGQLASMNGIMYEKQVHCITKKCYLNGKLFNTQRSQDLAGCSSKNDLNCNNIYTEDVGIEIKKCNTPDWMQCGLTFDFEKKIWKTNGKRSKIPYACQDIFDNIIKGIDIYDGDAPIFMDRKITHEEWTRIKKETTKWNDIYIDIPSDTISKLYFTKGCKYIQISDGYGLYHLGEDVCNFGVPFFDISQRLRIRTKIHSRKTKTGFCSLSVTISCQPVNIKTLDKSRYSLDNENKLPMNLFYSKEL